MTVWLIILAGVALFLFGLSVGYSFAMKQRINIAVEEFNDVCRSASESGQLARELSAALRTEYKALKKQTRGTYDTTKTRK